MNEQINLEEVDLLTSKVLDEAISSDDFARLEVLLLNPVCRRRYLDLMLQESLLHWEESKTESLTLEDPIKPRLFPFPVISAVAAILVAVGGMIFIKFPDIMEDFYQSEKKWPSIKVMLIQINLQTRKLIFCFWYRHDFLS